MKISAKYCTFPIKQEEYNIPEEPRYILWMTPTGFINGQDESRCYVNFSFQVLFFDILFRQLIMNFDCEKMLNNLDDSEDDFRSCFQKIVIMKIFNQFFCEMLFDERKIVYTESFFEATNIRKMCRIIHQSLKYYFTKWCPRNPLSTNK